WRRRAPSRHRLLALLFPPGVPTAPPWVPTRPPWVPTGPQGVPTGPTPVLAETPRSPHERPLPPHPRLATSRPSRQRPWWTWGRPATRSPTATSRWSYAATARFGRGSPPSAPPRGSGRTSRSPSADGGSPAPSLDHAIVS